MRSIIKSILPFGLVKSIQDNNQVKLAEARTKHAVNTFESLRKSGKSINLELGGGDRKGNGEWTTLDIHPNADIPYDLLKPLPMADSSVDKIYSSHFLEHFHTRDIVTILKESYRILKPGGWVSACVPDGSNYINAYARKEKLDPNQWLRYKPAFEMIFSSIDVVNYMAYLDDEHKHLFDIENLLALFTHAGFKNVEPRTFIKGLDMEARDYQSIYVQATK